MTVSSSYFSTSYVVFFTEESNWSPQSQSSLDRSVPFAMPLKVYLIGLYSGKKSRIRHFEELRYLDTLISKSTRKQEICSLVSNLIREYSNGAVLS